MNKPRRRFATKRMPNPVLYGKIAVHPIINISENQFLGEVIGIGRNQPYPPDLKMWDKVVCAIGTGKKIKINGKDAVVLKESEIIALIT